MLLALALLACAPKPPPAAPVVAPALSGPLDLAATIPPDPLVASGTLDNGLQWFVEENGRPAHRAELRLVLRVGALAEDDDQRGLAHFLEHMAFNGTTHFPGNTLTDTMSGFGMEFGAHVNAYTSFDETVYQLVVPTDGDDYLETALQILRDQAGGMLLETADIEAERGVVLEELRTDKGADERIGEQLWLGQMAGSRYAERLPIGTEASLRGFAPDQLRRFYADWYRPELMAVIVVGDVQTEAVVPRIAALFGDLENPDDPRPLPATEVPAHPLRVQIITDPEARGATWAVRDQHDSRPAPTYGSYRDFLVEQLMVAVLSDRLSALADDRDGPLLFATADHGRINPGEAEWLLYASPVQGRELEALELALTEARRLRLHGVTDAERDRAVAALAQSYEAYHREREKTPSIEAAEELVRVVTEGETMPGIAAEYALAMRWLPQIRTEELTERLAGWLETGSPMIQLVMPAVDGVAVPTEAQVRAVRDRAAAAEVAPPADGVPDAPLLAPLPPAPGPLTVAARREVPALGATVLTLSNGIQLWLKPTEHADDEVILKALSPGGTSTLPDAAYLAAESSLGVGEFSGLGSFDAPELDRWLARTRARAWTQVGEASESVVATAPPDELETMLQLLVLGFTQQRFTEVGRDRYLRAMGDALAGWQRSPERPFEEAWTAATHEPGPRVAPWTPATLALASLETAQAVHAARFGNAADFTWILVGAFSPDAVEPLLLQYLGALPAGPGRESVGPHWAQPREESVEQVVFAGTEPKATVRMAWSGPFPDETWLRRNRFYALRSILGPRVERTLREELGGVYGVGVGADIESWPTGRYRMQFDFTCDPARVDELVAALEAEVAAIVAAPVSPTEVATEQARARRSREVDAATNGFWADAIPGALLRGEDPLALTTHAERVDRLDAAAVQAMAAEVFGPAAVTTRVVRMPAPAD